ncbi:MAG: division/cell wall cluster transcriptional repressor MraZ [Bacteroidota bacterium]
MSFFTSEYECKIDAKGRLALPAKIKGNLPESAGNEMVIRRGFEQCLILYPMTEYRKLYSKIAGLSEFNPEHRTIQRHFFRGSAEVELDGTGRFLIPKLMMGYAKLERDAIVLGIGTKIEIWNPSEYENNLNGGASEFSELAEKYLN